MARYQPPGGRGQQPRGTSPGRQLPPPDSVLRQRAVAALSLGFLSLLGLALGLGKRARRSGTARPRGAVAGVVLGSLGLAFSALWLLVLVVFWPQLSAYYNCMASANTNAAQQVCHTQFTNSIGGELGVLQNGR
jgi:hypothetical protein